MTETGRIKNALLNVNTLAKNSIEYGKARDDQDMDLIESIVEKEIPMKPKLFMRDGYDEDESVYDAWDCPYCGTHYQIIFDKHDYCPHCGQRLGWDLEEE